MKTSTIFIVSMLLFLSISCKKENNKNSNINKDYNKIIKLYPKVLKPIFPKLEDIKSDFSSYINFNTKYTPLQIFIEQKETKKQIDFLKSNSKKINKSDSTFYIVNKYLRKNNILDINKDKYRNKLQQFKQGAIPIPNFYDIDAFDENSINLLKTNYTLYSLESKAGQCCNQVLHKGNWNMPKEWENGYSIGYAIDSVKNKVIYWSVIW